MRALFSPLAEETACFAAPRVVVTYYERGNEISVYATQFQQDLDRLGELRFLKLWIQEAEAYGFNRGSVIAKRCFQQGAAAKGIFPVSNCLRQAR